MFARNQLIKRYARRVLALLIAASTIGLISYSSSEIAAAFGATHRAHIFSTNVSARGWEHSERAITQDLPANAPLESFSEQNAATLAIEGTRPVPQSDIPVLESTSTEPTSDAASTTPDTIAPSVSPSGPDQPTDAVTPRPTESGEAPQSSAPTTDTVSPPVDTPPPAADTPPADASAPSGAADVTSFIGNIIHTIGAAFASPYVPTVYATTTEQSPEQTTEQSLLDGAATTTSFDNTQTDATSTPIEESSDAPDQSEYVASCFLEQKECHTLTFSGFGVSGGITKKHFKHADVQFSFAAAVGSESGILDDKLDVRYYHAGKWKQAGEIFLNKDLSNESNGGYFSSSLDDITDWQSLDDLQVVIEYIRADDGRTVRLSVDSLWIDVDYSDTLLNEINGSADTVDDLSENVSLALRGEGTTSRVLVLPDGSSISFDYTDDLEDGLPIRTDRKIVRSEMSSSTDLYRSQMYISVTNPGDSSEAFTLNGAFLDGNGRISGLAQFLRNVASTTQTEVENDVTYLCDSKWEAATTSDDTYTCATTGEVHQCSWLNATRQNCLERNVTVGVASGVEYKSDWVDQDIVEVLSTDDSEMPNGYRTKSRSRKSFDILPGQTLYFRVEMETGQTDPQKFYLYVSGGSKFGDLESARIKRERELLVQKDKTIHKGVPHVQRARLNDQLTEKTEFSADDRPTFKFQFKTQRGFFTRLKDRLLGTDVRFEVKQARIKDSNGDESHVPVEIGYAVNEEWSLTLGTPPRAFKPGKYSIDLTVVEGGETYTDTLEFYWGVLASNSDKATYEPGETAHFEMAALDDSGNNICEAPLVLTITSPSGEMTDVPVQNGLGCGLNNVTELPDYFADYTVEEVGTSTITLSRLDVDGNIINSVNDALFVEESPKLSVSRFGPTRIYPLANYPMHIQITANEAYTGSITERVPEGFEVRSAGGARITRADGVIYLSWETSLEQGQTVDYEYVFDAPDASPYLYLLGPLRFDRADGTSFEEGRTWKIASDAVPVATGVAWVTGTSTTNGNDLNNNTPFALVFDKSEDFDDTYFSHSTSTNASRITVNVAGDYLVAVNVPFERADTSGNRTTVEVDVRVNGAKQDKGVGRGFIRTFGSHSESSAQVYVLLRNLSAGDYIEAYSHTIGTVTAGDVILIGSRASMYAEYIPSTETVFSATATTTLAGDNLNPATATKVVWYDVGGRVDTGYSHNNATSSNPDRITISSAGDYMTFVNIPLNGTGTANTNTNARIFLNGVEITSGEFRQGYIDNTGGATQSSLQWSGIVHATSSNSILTVDVQAEAKNGTVNIGSDKGSIYLQKVPASDVFFASGMAVTTNGNSWNNTAQSVQFATSTLVDTNTYTHSTTSNSHQVTVKRAGDYLLAFNDTVTGAVTRANETIQVLKNGVSINGAQSKTNFIRNTAGHASASASLVFFLRDLAVNDVITVTTTQEAGAGTISSDIGASLMLWRKNPQSSFIQNSFKWYANANAEPPTDAWPTGANDLVEGDVITDGVPIKSGDQVRLRMNLLANSTTTAFADQFTLQYAAGSTCSAALSWADVGATGSGTIWRFHDNAGVTTNTTLSSTTLAATTVTGSYSEQNPSTTTPSSVGTNGAIEYDWSLQNNGAAAGTDYCFRMINGSTGQALKDYVSYPQLTTDATPDTPVMTVPFDNQKIASTTPWFQFSSSDPNGEDLHYEVQVSTDPNFGSTVLDRDSSANFLEFQNLTSPADKSPFNQSETIRFTPTTALASSTTYWWRVRAKDPTGTNTYGNWSSPTSFTTDTTVTVTTWHQTTQAQFLEDQLLNSTTTTSDDVQISGVLATSTVISPTISFSNVTYGNTWGNFSWNHTITNGTISYQVQYFTSTSSWALIPDTDLTGNSTGFTTSPVSLANLDTGTYANIRVVGNLTRGTATPNLLDWTVAAALSVTKPVLSKPFDNEKTATTTPTFQFISTDPQSDDLTYQIQWSTDPTFVSGVVTRTSDANAGFSNTASSTDTNPFTQNQTAQFQMQVADALTNGTTYWWRVRAKDPNGANAYSQWATGNSFTVDTSLSVSTWFQTTQAQFAKDTLTRTIASTSNAVLPSTDTGKIAIFRTATAGEALTTSVFTHGFDTTVRRDDLYTLTGTTTVTVKQGHYAVLYSTRYDSTAGTNRTNVQSNLTVGGTSIAVGWANAYLRRTNGAQEGFHAGGGIIYAPADSTQVQLQSFRTDTNAGATQTRVASTTLQFIKLDDSWDYIRLGKNSKQAGPTSASWLTVTYDRQDEYDATSYDHTVGSGNITLLSAGHYLVFANTYGSLASGSTNETQVKQKLKLNGTDVEGSFTTVYMRGNTNTNGIYEGAVALGMIIEATTSNSVLNVQLARSIGTAAWSIDGNSAGTYVDRTGLTIVKIPEGDFIRLQDSSTISMNTSTSTAITWNTEAEKDTASFTHSNTSNNSRVTAAIAGDYLFFGQLFAQGTNITDGQPGFSWAKNGGLVVYGMSGTYSSNTTTSDAGNWLGQIMPSVINGDYFQFMSEAFGAAGSMPVDHKSLQAVRIASLSEADTNAVTVQSQSINFSDGTGPKWGSITWNATQPASTSVKIQVQYLNASGTYALVPDNAGFVSGYLNSVGTTSTSTINISGLSRITYATLRILATLTSGGGNTPSLNDWTVNWAQGISISGTAKQFDETTNVTSGTVAVAVNGVLQSGKTGTISGGVWTIPNVTAFSDDVITVWISGATDAQEAVAITKYQTTGDVTGMELYEDHLSLGSDDNPTLTNIDISKYDNSVSSNEDIFHNVDAGNDLAVCGTTNCTGNKLYVRLGTTYEPDISSSGDVTTKDISIKGILIADGNTINVSGSWAATGQFAKGNSTVVFNATSTTQSVDFTGATSTSFNNVTFGQSGTATWTLSSAIDVTGTLTINNGTLSPGSRAITLSGDLTIGASGVFAKGTATTTFNGSSSKIWTDSTAAKQDLGIVVVDGTSKTITLGSSVKATNITIGADDTLNAGGANTITVNGNWSNNNIFTAQTGTVLFASTSTGNTVAVGSSSFYNLTFNGSGGNWAFSGATASVSNDFTITAGTVTLPTGTTTVTGNFTNNGTFQHNNGTVLMNSAASGKTITASSSSFYDLTFNGAGSWSFSGASATSSRNVTIAAGTVTMPSNTLAIGGFFANNGGSFTHNSGTLRFTATNAQTVKLGNSSANNLTFSGTGGGWTFSDTNATSTGTFRVEAGTTTLPTGVLAVGGSWTIAGGGFTAGLGTVRFTASATGQTVQAGNSSFYNVFVDSIGGGWTINQNATTTNNFNLNKAGTFAVSSGVSLAIGNTFTNAVLPATTTWTGSTLNLYGGATYAVNTKSSGGDTYATVVVSGGTKVSWWNSSAATTSVAATGYLYSQDNAGVDGDLYIYGDYTRSSGTEYWSYATDFDGTALGGSPRQANIRVATSSTLTFSGGTLQILGVSSATTTIANQGSGAFAFAVSGGTLNAQYYQLRNTDLDGLNISGTTAITTLSDGDFQLGVNTGTMMKVASTVIDANAALQIQRNRFATSTGITSGANVTETGTPSSYWWFRNHYGNYAGENYDSDPGGNPGYIRWDDSSISITVSGTVYADHGSSAIGNPPCDGVTKNVKIIVNGNTSGTIASSTCNAGTGAFSVSGVTFTGDVVLTAYLDTNGGKQAVTITRTPSTDIANFDLYQNAVIVRHEDVTPITIQQVGIYDGNNDSDIPFTASTSSNPATLTLKPDTELYIWAGKTFTPGGNVTLQSGGSGNIRDGRLMLATSSAFVASGTESHALGGGLSVASGATLTAASSTFTFNATTTAKAINSSVPLSFYNLAFNGTGGGWSLDSSATTTASNSFSLSAGTLSGTGDMKVLSGSVTGAGVISMTGGTFLITGTGSIGSANNWTFNNLTLGAGATDTTSKTGVGTTTVSGVLTVNAGQTLNASTTNWVLTGGGIPFVQNGTLNAQGAPFFFTSNASTTIADAPYAALYFAPAAAGTPVYTLKGGSLGATLLTVGGVNPVYIDADTNDPSIGVTGSVTIGANSTYKASNVGAFDVGGSWQNSGTFVHQNGSVNFNSGATGNTVNPGSSSFYDLSFNNVSGGWTITQNATTSRHFTLTQATSFTLANGKTLSVGGTFTNGVGGSATTWATTTLSLISGTAFSANTKSGSGDTYGTLFVSSNTKVAMWNSSAATTTVSSGSSLYSQDHAGVDGDLYIWGDYTRSSGTEYWDYATDFDGVSLATSTPRAVNVRIATSSTLTFSGGTLEILGTTTATTSIAVQGSGRYAWSVSGGTLNAQFYKIRDTDINGLNISGSTAVTSLSDGDFLLSANGGTTLTVTAAVIDANPLKIIMRNSFATTSVITGGSNVKATGSAASSWKFNLHYGNFAGEAYDSDPTGDPGYLRWDDSASQITVQGNVYSDEGTTVSGACDGSTQVVRLKVQGAGTFTSACSSVDGLYTIPNVAFNPGDTLTVYLDNATGTRRAANVSVDPVSSISNMHLYENRVIVRHEDTNPITIAQMAQYDSDQDADIPFNAVDAATDTLTLVPNTKLIVFNNKTFAPGGNITLQSGGLANSYDGTLELYSGATFTGAANQSHAIGGSLLLGGGTTFNSASSTVTMTATTSGKTLTLNNSVLYNLVFSGTGGNWAFASSTMTALGDFIVTAGTVTLPSATSTIQGSFINSGGTVQHNNGTLYFTATTTGKTVRLNGSNLYSIEFNGTGGAWSFFDTSATSSNNVTITAGTVTAPTTMFTIGGSFQNFGTYTAGVNTTKFIANTTGKSIRTGSSPLYNVLIDGVGGGWTYTDTNATTTRDFTILHGTTTLPTGTLSVGGSWSTSGGGFNGTSTVSFNATTTGKTIDPGISTFSSVEFNSSAGGWTITQNATSTVNFTLTAASSFTLTNGKTLAVGGTFTNGVGGSATTWATTTLSLYSATAYSMNTKSAGNDVYGTLSIGANTDVRMWNSTAATTTVDSTGSLYSQDNATVAGTGVDGDLYIWGEYVRSSGNDYWSYATDFDGTALGGSSRAVNVRIATSSTLSFTGGGLEIVGASSATTTIQNQGTGRFSFAVSGGTLNARYWQVKNTDPTGINLTGTPSITSLDDGDLELGVSGGAIMTVAGSVVDANASKFISNVRFATSTGVLAGYNVVRTGSPISAWTFSSHYGNIAGESYDSDGGDACGSIRWANSVCLFVSQEHYRWRNDDGGLGVPSSEWYSASWSKREKIAVSNPTGSAMTNQPVKITIPYDADMQSDFDDLRFTDSSGTTTIPYWIEKYTASTNATVWVKIASIPASGSADVYVYYGNNTATDLSSGTTTFKTFEDFESNSLSGYSGDTSLFQTSTSFNHNHTYGLDAGSHSGEFTTSGLYKTGTLSAQGDTIRFYQYVDSTYDDEPCTLFGVGGSGTNYAVCLDQYPTDKVSIAKNVTRNDDTGTVLASTTVTFTSGWYETRIDWLTDNSINVTVYKDDGSTFATATTSDSSRTSGGYGFSYWFQHGGWDFYSVRPYVSSEPTYVIGTEQVNAGASWKAAEDTSIPNLSIGQNVRLRFSVQNSGSAVFNHKYTLQYAAKGNALNCESVTHANYADVPASGSCGSSPMCMASTAQYSDGASISSLLSYPASMNFVNGTALSDTSNQTASSTIAASSTSEFEYNFQVKSFATANSYCFRVANKGTNTNNDYDLDNYAHVAQATVSYDPTISNFNFPLNYILSGIALTEGATTTVSATGTVTDLNGYSDIVLASSTIYRSGVGSTCSANENNCYKVPSCGLSACSGNSCTITCSADVQYFAEPTDAGTYSAESWLASVRIQDSLGLSATSSAEAEMGTLRALSVTASINYEDDSTPGMQPGADTGSRLATTTVSNTGNSPIDIALSGTGVGTIPVGQQHYATSTFNYSACSVCALLSGAATNAGLNIPKVTASTTPTTSDVYWGIAIPIPTAAGLQSGTNYFEAGAP